MSLPSSRFQLHRRLGNQDKSLRLANVHWDSSHGHERCHDRSAHKLLEIANRAHVVLQDVHRSHSHLGEEFSLIQVLLIVNQLQRNSLSSYLPIRKVQSLSSSCWYRDQELRHCGKFLLQEFLECRSCAAHQRG